MEKICMIMLGFRIGFTWEIDYKDANTCACNQLLLDSECNWENCAWDPTLKTCSDEHKETCSLVDDKVSCIRRDYC